MMDNIITAKDYRKLFDAAFDAIEQDSSKHNMNHILTSLDSIMKGTIDYYTKEYGQQEEKIESLKAECTKLENDSAKYHALYVDLQRKVNVANTVKYNPYPLQEINPVIIDYQFLIKKNAEKEPLVDLSNLRKISF
jgi:hypothetical protein